MLKVTPVKTPLVAKKMFPSYVWDMATTNKELYLTFDDGPTPDITNWTLETLKLYHAKATFFCIGANIKKYPVIFKNILIDGHVIGNHTQNHVKGWKTKTKDYVFEVEKAQSVIQEAHVSFQAFDSATFKDLKDSSNLRFLPKGETLENYNTNSGVKFFRPPYGQIKPKQGRKLIELGYQITMWDVLSFDWEQDLSEEKCLENVISKSKSGSIIVFHDSVKASKNLMYALPKVLEFFSKKGYKFKSLF